MTARRLGCYPSPSDPRDFSLEALCAVSPALLELAATALPPAFTVPYSVAPLNQGNLPQCVAYSGALLRTLTEWPEAGQEVDFDPADIYAGSKAIDGIAGPGTTVRAAARFLYETGALATDGPLAGRRLKIAAYGALSGLDQIKVGILAGGAWLALDWSPSWMRTRADGTLPPWTPNPTGLGHGIAGIGYDDGRAALLLENSWGASWGLGGRCWLPYAELSHLWEAWKTVDAPDPTPVARVATRYTAIDPRRLLDTRRAGGAPVQAHTPRRIQVTGWVGVPADAVAVTGKVGVVRPSEPGWLNLSPLDDVPRDVSTLDFRPDTSPVDAGFTCALAPYGHLTVYATSALHLILDVTGYFE